MPRLIDTETRAHALLASINDVLAERGATGLTLRHVARLSGVSTSSMLHHFGATENLFRYALNATAALRLDASARAAAHERPGAASLLPGDDEDVLLTRAWLAWLELSRSETYLETGVALARERELAYLARCTGYALSRDGLEVTGALIDGLRLRICHALDPLPPARAVALLEQHLDSVGVVSAG